jgi:ornithine lipid ester-linked acyl 2-hydroxylase
VEKADAAAVNPQHFRRPFPIQELLEGGHRALNAYNRAVARWSVHGSRALFEPRDFPWVAAVEAEWRAVRAELDAVLARPEQIPQFADVSPDQVHLTPPGKWKTFFFMAYGVRVEENCRRCPATMRALARIPGVQTAFFSILEARTHIQPHKGPYGGVLRYHLALEVPEPRSACRIRVDDQVASWEEGRSLVFDDTYEHEAWNDTDGRRVILFVDFERPLPRALAALNRLFIRIIAASPFVQDGIERYEEWTRRRGGGASTQHAGES